MTTGSAGGLLCPCKGLLLAAAVAALNIIPIATCALPPFEMAEYLVYL